MGYAEYQFFSMGKKYTNYSKTSKNPRRPFEREKLINELKLVGTYGLRCKREVWRTQLTLAKLRKAARILLTMDENDPRRLFEGEALIRRMVRIGLLKESERKLAQSVHHARVLILQRHIAVGKQMVNVPSFVVRTSSENHIQYSATSVYKTGKNGRVKRKKAGGGDGGDD